MTGRASPPTAARATSGLARGAPALARKALWRTVFSLSGGLRVHGASALPSGPCVIVANHRSHADTVALLAAVPARRRPAVAAAADYWFCGGARPWICQALCAAFPVRRAGGGSADLAAAARLLAAGRDVIVFPEGTRSRDGRTGEFHRGAARLAAAAARRAAPRWNSPVRPSRERVPSGKTITSRPAASSRAAAARSALPPPARRTGNAAHSAWQIHGRAPPQNQ